MTIFPPLRLVAVRKGRVKRLARCAPAHCRNAGRRLQKAARIALHICRTRHIATYSRSIDLPLTQSSTRHANDSTLPFLLKTCTWTVRSFYQGSWLRPMNANPAPLTARTARRCHPPGRAFAFKAPLSGIASKACSSGRKAASESMVLSCTIRTRSECFTS